MKLSVIYEDNHLLMVNKPAGRLVQGDKTQDPCLIDDVKDYLRKKYHKPGNIFVGLVHRLDRPASGLVSIAKTSKALTRLNQTFKDRAVEKTYWIVVKNKPAKAQDRLVHWMQKNQKKNKSFTSNQEQEEYKKAVLTYELIASSDHYHLLEIQLETGRHHQIRAQLASIGCPIKGDLKYGAKRPNQDGSIHLLAKRLSFLHPVKKEKMQFEAPLPDEALWQSFASLD